MGESSSTKKLLEILADSEQSLSPQFSQSQEPIPKRFACFADLTTEIRLQIWNLTLPPHREYNIAAHRNKPKKISKYHTCGSHYCIHAPIALFINRESRYETLCWYNHLIRDRMAGGKSILQESLFYRNSKGLGNGDTLYVNIQSILGLKIEDTEFDWVTAFLKNNKEGLGEIEELEIREWQLDDVWKRHFKEREVRLLDGLEALKRVKCVVQSWYYYGLTRNFEERLVEMEVVREMVGAYFGGRVVVEVEFGKSDVGVM